MSIVLQRCRLMAMSGLLCFAASASAQGTASTATAITPGTHTSEAAQASPQLAQDFKRLFAPIKDASWLSSYGTTGPSVTDKVDMRQFVVFHGCKPHDCISESYTIAVDPATGKIAAGVFVRSTFDGPRMTDSRITWVGDTQWDTVVMLGKYLY